MGKTSLIAAVMDINSGKDKTVEETVRSLSKTKTMQTSTALKHDNLLDEA